jgi:hypothetical protein
MIAGFLGLAFNPTFWVAVGLTAAVSFSSGVFKGWSDSRADQYAAEIVELRRASAQKDAIIAADAERQMNSLQEKAALEAQLDELLKGNGADSCKLSDSALNGLRKLASGK